MSHSTEQILFWIVLVLSALAVLISFVSLATLRRESRTTDGRTAPLVRASTSNAVGVLLLGAAGVLVAIIGVT